MYQILLLALCFRLCMGYPFFYVHPPVGDPKFANAPIPAITPGCLDHPTQAYGPHAPSEVDTSTTVTLTEQGKTTGGAASLCLGRSYDVKVSFPSGSTRYALLTTTAGQLQPSNSYFNDTACNGKRLIQYQKLKPSGFNTTLFVPCNTTASSTKLVMTSAEGATSAFLNWSTAIPIKSCSTTACVDTLPVYSQPLPPPVAAPQPPSAQQSGNCAPKQFASTNCTASSMGYSCTIDTSQGSTITTIHYALGGCAPSNECSKVAYFPEQLSSSEAMLHMAAESATQGWVGVGFAQSPGLMQNMDAVVGWMDDNGEGSINMYPVSELTLGDPYPTALLAYSGVVRTSAGKTIICFGRPLSLPSAQYSAAVQPTVLKLNWAVGTQAGLSMHKAAQGLILNMASGASSVQDSGKKTFILVHGALMAAAWILLFPLGVLLARHKWVLGAKKLAGIHIWFHGHRMVQLLGFFAMLTAFIIALVKLDVGESKLGKLHNFIGIVVFALTGAQILGTVPRPKGDARTRYLWNQLHHWTGRLLLTGGIATVYIGIVMLHRKSGGQYSYAPWLFPTCVVLGVLILFEVALSVAKLRRREENVSEGKAVNRSCNGAYNGATVGGNHGDTCIDAGKFDNV